MLILMSISLLFSVVIYAMAVDEIHDRLNDFQTQIETPVTPGFLSPNHRFLAASREDQWQISNRNIIIRLAYINLLILIVGGVGSLKLARRSLRHIEHAHDSQSRFTSEASHQLRTPLAIMQSELEVALRDPKLTKTEMREILESNLEEVDRLTRLTHTLLKMSKMEHSDLKIGVVNLSTVTRETIQTYDPNQKLIKLKDLPQDLYVSGNLESVRELLAILVDNAIKYSKPGSKIQIELKRNSRLGSFVITNTGVAIPQGKLPHIFDRFYRGDESNNAKGYGLGLALAKEIVSFHNGELQVSSNSKDTTTFQVRLPVRKKSN